MKYKVGDVVRTTKDESKGGIKLFPIGTIGTITYINDGDSQPYEVNNGFSEWWYSENMLELASTEKTYEQGLNDAWELEYKLLDMNFETRVKVFGAKDIMEILRDFTPQEALAKLKAYEDSKIEAGDVVETENGIKAVVFAEANYYIEVLTQNGQALCWDKGLCKKTGKNIDIKSILEQIGE